MRHLFDLPFAFRICADQGFAGARVDDLTRAAEDQLADVEAVLQDAVLTLAVAVDGGSAPIARLAALALRSGHAVIVEAFCNGARAGTGGELLKDARDDLRLYRIDLTKTAHQLAIGLKPVGNAIAVGDAIRVALGRDRAALATLHLGGEILAELCVHQPAECGGDVGHFAIGQGEDACTGKRDTLANGKGVTLMTCNSIGRLGDNLINPALLDPCQHGVEARPRATVYSSGAADCEVGENVDNLPAFALAPLTAESDLVFDRARVLKRAGEAGVDQRAHMAHHDWALPLGLSL